MSALFFIVGPTGVGKSEIAAEAALRCGGEIIGADAFQIYKGLDVLTAKPSAELRAKVPHHLIGVVPVGQGFDAAQYAVRAGKIAADVSARDRLPIVTGGTGLYVRALVHGLADMPQADAALREKLEAQGIGELHRRLAELDPLAAEKIDAKNKRRLIRAVEVCILSGKPFSSFRDDWREAEGGSRPPGAMGQPAAEGADQTAVGAHQESLPLRGPSSPSRPCSPAHLPPPSPASSSEVAIHHGVFLTRDRGDLHDRVNRRVVAMFRDGVVNEVRAMEREGATAGQVLGLKEIRALIAGEMDEKTCIERIQAATRQYAKRQLTWFRRQTMFDVINLSALDFDKAVQQVVQKIAETRGIVE